MKVNITSDSIEKEYEGLRRIISNGYYNWLDKDNNFISNQWYDFGGDFNEGFAVIKRKNNTWNYINKLGEELSKEEYRNTASFYNGIARVVKMNGKYNFINYDGEDVFSEDFNYVFDFNESGYAQITCNDNKKYLLNREGNIYEAGKFVRNIRKNKGKTTEIHYRYIGSLVDGYSVIQKLNNRYNYITINNEYLSTEDFDDAHTFCNGFAMVEKDGKKYYLNTKGFLYDYDTRKIIKYIGNNKEKATQELFNELLSKLYKEEELINNCCNTTNNIINDIMIENEKLKRGLADKHEEIEELKEKYEVLHH